jgi:uncharacterized protein (TIGR03067 family)
MRTKLASVVLLGVALAPAGAAARGNAKEVKAELAKFEGTWAIESVRFGGKEVSGPYEEKIRFTFAGNKLTLVDLNVKSSEEGPFKIDPAKKPPHIDVTVKGKTRPGIYAFEGDRLKICTNAVGEVRPAEFSAPEGSKAILFVLKRLKK